MIHFLLDFDFLFFNFYPLRVICEFSITWLDYKSELYFVFLHYFALVSSNWWRRQQYGVSRKRIPFILLGNKEEISPRCRKKPHSSTTNFSDAMRINRMPWIRCLWNLGKRLDGVVGCCCEIRTKRTIYIGNWIQIDSTHFIYVENEIEFKKFGYKLSDFTMVFIFVLLFSFPNVDWATYWLLLFCEISVWFLGIFLWLFLYEIYWIFFSSFSIWKLITETQQSYLKIKSDTFSHPWLKI